MTPDPAKIIAKINKQRPLMVTDSRPFLYHSKLIAYEEKYGRPYSVPPCYQVIEDVKG